MVPANELRVGSYAYYKYWNPHPENPSFELAIVKIVGFLKGTYYFEFLNKKGVHKTKKLYHIPLTEGILLKCGGVTNPYHDRIEIGDIHFEVDKTGSGTIIWCIKYPYLTVLHRLQNLYFELNNKELEVNL